MKKNEIKILLSLTFLLIHLGVFASQIQPRWIQKPVISPNGEWIAFGYKGNIFKVRQSGGEAIQLTNDGSYNSYPIWSNNSNTIAFSSIKKGNSDVYIMNSSGKNVIRLTYNSSSDIPYYFSENDDKVYFGSSRNDVFTSLRFPYRDLFKKLYQVAVKGGSSQLVNSAGMEFAHYNKANDAIIFQDNKGSIEDPFRKHAVSSITRDIWVYRLKTNSYIKVSNFKGEDREPLWGRDNDIYYLSEKNGSQNLYKSSLTDPSKMIQLTNFEKHPVRSISKDVNGKFAFTYNGDIYTLEEGKQPVKLAFTLNDDSNDIVTPITVESASDDMDVSADGKQFAFVSRGDVYVTSQDGLLTKKITNTPYQEKMIQFSPDGRKLLFSVEKNGSWDIDQISTTDGSQPYFYLANNLARETVIGSSKDEFQGIYSPDGNKIAYLEERSVLKTYDLNSKQFNTLLPAGINYSQSDGDQYFAWSPDSKYLIVQGNNLLLVKDEQAAKNFIISQGPFKSKMPHWGISGKVMYSLSPLKGLTNFTHTESQYDIVKTYFDNETWYNDRFKRGQSLTITPLTIDLTNEQFNSKTITNAPASILDIAISNDEKKMYFLARYYDNYDLYTLDTESGKITLFAAINAQNPKMKMSQDGSSIYLVVDGDKVKHISTADAKVNDLAIKIETNANETQERAYMLDHIYNVTKDKFSDPKLNGVDFDFYYSAYKEFLPFINNGYDFQMLLKEFLGELNNSHLIPRYGPNIADRDATATLGLFYDESRSSDGLLVKEIIAEGPFDNGITQLKAGMIIDKIDGNAVTQKEDWSQFLNNKAGKLIKIDFHNTKTGLKYQEDIKPIDSNREKNVLLYKRWIKKMEHLTDSLSGGKIGYIHVSQMGEKPYREIYDKALGSLAGKKALLVDTRYNTGGSLTGDLVTFLSGKVYLTERGNGMVNDTKWPENKWNKPSCVVMNETNYSDASIFPYVYKHLKIGKLIGMPVPGTGTGTTWEDQINPEIYVGIPDRAVYTAEEKLRLENYQIEPDILVNNNYEKILLGSDQQ
ncbi:MAG: S41 family peptidase, partial [Flavobacterium sp.]